MTRILLEGLNEDLMKTLTNKLTEIGNEVFTTSSPDLLRQYEEVLPDLLLMKRSDQDTEDDVRRIVEFDSTACVFVMTENMDLHSLDTYYKSGVRVVLPMPEKKKIDDFVTKLYDSCNDLQHEKCIGCWKLDRFENLQKIH
ncbi:MAG: hypothetical protein ACXAE3_04035 [Candidatus Kariarchaeaceae archaeon]|jgi:hypothetical protein